MGKKRPNSPRFTVHTMFDEQQPNFVYISFYVLPLKLILPDFSKFQISYTRYNGEYFHNFFSFRPSMDTTAFTLDIHVAILHIQAFIMGQNTPSKVFRFP